MLNQSFILIALSHIAWTDISLLFEDCGANIRDWYSMDSFITRILFVSFNPAQGSDFGVGRPPVLERYSSSHRPSVNAPGQVHRFDWLWT